MIPETPLRADGCQMLTYSPSAGIVDQKLSAPSCSDHDIASSLADKAAPIRSKSSGTMWRCA